MRALTCTAASIAVALLLFSKANGASLNLFTPVEIAPRTWLLAPTVPGEPEVGVVIGEHSVAVIGAPKSGVYARQILEHVAELTSKPVRYVVVLAHYCDYACASEEFADAATIVASDSLDPAQPLEWASEPLEGPEYYAGAGIAKPELAVRSRTTLDLGGRKVVVEKAPGTRAALIAHQPDAKILWPGALARPSASPVESAALRAALGKLIGYRVVSMRAGTQATPS